MTLSMYIAWYYDLNLYCDIDIYLIIFYSIIIKIKLYEIAWLILSTLNYFWNFNGTFFKSFILQ